MCKVNSGSCDIPLKDAENGSVKVKISGFSPLDQSHEVSGGLCHRVARPQGGMVGEEQTQCGSCPTESDTSLAPALLADPKSWSKACSGFDEIAPLDLAGCERELLPESRGSGMNCLIEGDMLNPGIGNGFPCLSLALIR